MPNGDGTGPNGNGPLSGRRMGSCGEKQSERRGYGRNRGAGRGFGMNWVNAQGSSQSFNEKSWLENTIEAIKDQLKALEKRKKELDN